MFKRIVLLSLAVVLVLAFAAPVFASQPIQASVASITPTDGSALGQIGSRIYSVSGSDTGINNNQAGTNPGCVNNRCARGYTTLGGFGDPGGFPATTENTAAYNTDADNQTMYVVWDGQVNGSACNHVAFFAAQGMIASSTVLPTGDFRKPSCNGTLAGNCFFRGDTSNADPNPLTNVNQGYQGPHTITSIGGLSPVPVVRTSFPGSGCPAGQARLTWNDPWTYSAAMKDNVESPVLGVRLYSINSACSSCPSGTAAGWSAGAVYPLGAGSAGICVPVTGPTWYALTVVFHGPGNVGGNDIESGRVGGAGFVGTNSQCVAPGGTATRISNLTARYAGRGSVGVTWTSGTEGGVQSFYVTRSASPEGPFTRISEAVTPVGDGHTYSVMSKVHTALGRTVYYSIEIVDAEGVSERFGPIAVNLPAAKKKFGTQ